MNRTLIFDIDDTLYDQTLPIYEASLQASGISLEDPEAFYSVFHRRSNEVFFRVQDGEMSLEQSRIDRYILAMQDMGFSCDEYTADRFQHLYEDRLANLKLSPAFTALFDELYSSGIRMGILTNGPSEHQRMKYRALGLQRWIPEENVLVSGDTSWAKPDPRLFEDMVRRMGGSPASFMMIGDSWENDIIPAYKAGWETLWYTHHGQKRPADAPPHVPDGIVQTEKEMTAYLRILCSKAGYHQRT